MTSKFDFKDFDVPGGKFGLSYQRSYVSFDDDWSGSGTHLTVARFDTAIEREFYKTQLNDREQIKSLNRELAWLKESVRGLLTPKGRVRRKKLLELVERLPAPDAPEGVEGAS